MRTKPSLLAAAAVVTVIASAHAARADEPSADRPAAPNSESSDTHGVVGTLSFVRPMQLGSAGGETERSCANVGSDCTASGLKGGGLAFSVGYMWRYIGFDVVGAATFDSGSRGYVDAKNGSQSYDLNRIGGMAALRLRGELQSRTFRASAAVGPGFVYRLVAASQDWVPTDSASYASAALTADLNVQWRLGRSTAIVVGAMTWLENAGEQVTTTGAPTKGLAGLAASHGVSVPGAQASNDAPYHLVSGPQITVMPYIGFQFGP